MGERSRSRRSVLQYSSSLAALGVLGSLAGCGNPLGETEGSSDSPSQRRRVDLVPGGSEVALNVNVASLLSNPAVEERANELLSRVASQQPGDSPQTLEGVLDRIESNAGIDPRGLAEVLVFGRFRAGERFGVVAWTEWTSEQLQSLMEADTQVEERTYGGKTVYADEGAGSSGAWVATLASGTFAFGTKPTVQSIVDVWNGDAEPVAGETREAFTSASSGTIRFGFDVPTSEIQSESSGPVDPSVLRTLRYGYGSLSGGGDGTELTVNLRAESQDGAAGVRGFLATGKSMAQRQLSGRDSPMAAFSREVVEGTSISQDGRTVVVRNANGTDAVVLLLGGVLGSFVLGVGRQTSRSAPQAVFEFEYDAGDGTLQVTHNGGDSIPGTELVVAGENVPTGTWLELGGSASTDSDVPEVVAGDRLTLQDVPTDVEVSIVWRPSSGDRSQALARYHGPDA